MSLLEVSFNDILINNEILRWDDPATWRNVGVKLLQWHVRLLENRECQGGERISPVLLARYFKLMLKNFM